MRDTTWSLFSVKEKKAMFAGGAVGRGQGGKSINIASAVGRNSNPDGAYCASKAGVVPLAPVACHATRR